MCHCVNFFHRPHVYQYCRITAESNDVCLVSTSTLAKYKIRILWCENYQEQEYKREKTDASDNFKKNHQHCTIIVWADYSIW